MTKEELIIILEDVFIEYTIDKQIISSFAKVCVKNPKTDVGFELFTYNKENTDDSVWYFSIYLQSNSREIMIPNRFARDFIEDFYEMWLLIEDNIIKSTELLLNIKTLKEDTLKHPEKLLSRYRDNKIKSLTDLSE